MSIDILDFDFTDQGAVLPADLYLPEGRDAGYIEYLGAEAERYEALGDADAADHYRNRLAVAEVGMTMQEVADLRE